MPENIIPGLLVVVFGILFLLREIFSFRNQLQVKYVLTPMLTVTLLLIAVMAGFEHPLNGYRALIISALLFSLVADTLLMIVETDLMIYGILFFLLAHIFYCGAFLLYFDFEIFHGLIALIILVCVCIIFYHTGRNAGKLKIPVAVYTVILGVMVFAALTSGKMIIAAGALLFAVSDTTIAIDSFRKPIPHSTVWTWAMYGPAQLLFALSCYC